MSRPLIVLPSRKVTQDYGHNEWYRMALVDAGARVADLPYTTDLDQIRKLVIQSHAVLLPGGEDVDPAQYGKTPHPKTCKPDSIRDTVEIDLAQFCFNEGKPLLGICRGQQVMGVALGGTLIQDIPSEVSHALNHKGREWNEFTHTIRIEVGSELHSVMREEKVLVNSLHHQALCRVAPELRVSAAASDGVIEAVQAPAKRYYVGVQCHPEVIYRKFDDEKPPSICRIENEHGLPNSPTPLMGHVSFDSRWIRLFKRFVRTARLVSGLKE